MDNGGNHISQKILDLQIAQSASLGRMEGRLDGIDQRLHNIDQRLELSSSATHRHGEALATMEMATCNHTKKISDLYHKVGLAEDTGVIHLAEEQTRWRTLQWIAAILVGALSVIGAGLGAIRFFIK